MGATHMILLEVVWADEQDLAKTASEKTTEGADACASSTALGTWLPRDRGGDCASSLGHEQVVPLHNTGMPSSPPRLRGDGGLRCSQPLPLRRSVGAVREPASAAIGQGRGLLGHGTVEAKLRRLEKELVVVKSGSGRARAALPGRGRCCCPPPGFGTAKAGRDNLRDRASSWLCGRVTVGAASGGIAAASPPVCCPMPGPPLMRRPGSPGGGGPSRWRRGGRGCAGPRARLLDGPVRYPVAAPPADCVRVARLTRQDVASPLPRRPRSCERHEYIRDTDMNAVEPQSGKGHGPPRGEEGSCTM